MNKELEINNWYNIEIAENTKDPELLTKILKENKDDEASQRAASNPYCPQTMLREILRRDYEENIISFNAVDNPNCPQDILIEILRNLIK